MKILFSDIRAQHASLAEEINTAIGKVIDSCAFINGKYVEEFEENFAAYCGAKNCIGVGNGTDALFISLKVLGIGPGDEVLVPANTFIATAEAVTMAGATIKFVDCDPHTYTIDVNKIKDHISGKTAAIIPVHLYGHPANMVQIRKICDENKIFLVQDCAQAVGASIGKTSLAAFGDLMCFSFYPGKNLGAYGDAGAVVTNDDNLAEKIRMFANHGRKKKYDHCFEGINSRMDGIQGAILNIKLKKLPLWTDLRIHNAKILTEHLKELKGIGLPYVTAGYKHVFHLYVIRTQERNKLIEYLNNQGIATGIHYPDILPNLKAYRHLGYTPDDFPIANSYQDVILSLPIAEHLSKKDLETIGGEVKKFYQEPTGRKKESCAVSQAL